MKNKVLPSNEISLFCEQISMILRSGMPLHDGLEALKEHYQHSRYASHFQKLHENVEANLSFYESLSGLGIFPSYMINVVRIAEMTGKLENAMDALADYYRKDDSIKRMIRQALMYPGILIVLMAIVVTVLVVKVLPIFNGIYRNLGSELYPASSALMDTGSWIGRIVLILISIILCVAIVSLILAKNSKNDNFLVFAGKIITPISRLRQKISAQRFASAMSMLMVSGHPLLDSVTLAKGVTEDRTFSAKVDALHARMQQEESFSEAVVEVGLFEDLHNRMLKVGATTGQTDHVLSQLSDIYTEEVDDMIVHLISLIEPTCVVLLSVAIGAILLAVMLPLVGIIGSIGI